MAALRYWDASQNQWILLPGSQGQTYAQVTSGTAPNPNAPVLSPPMGALWVDTSTTAPMAPYVPPQTPPATGNNVYTDSAGEQWFSQNGSAWRKARDVVHSRVYRNAAYTLPAAAWTAIPYDTVDRDVFGFYSVANKYFTTPMSGWYQVNAMIQLGAAPTTGQFLMSNIYKNGANTVAGGQQTWTGSGNWPVAGISAALYCSSGDTLQPYAYFSAALAISVGTARCYADFHYIGSPG